ncbi:MAG: hypothetical protein RJB38_1874 [Pseudomonadota bacterium]|jgi:hypothetical protein
MILRHARLVKLQAALALLVLLLAGGASATDASYRHTSWFEGRDDQTCQSALDAIALRFSVVSGAKVVERKCGAVVEISESSGAKFYRPMILIYQASNPIQLTTVRFGRDSQGLLTGDYSGGFASFENCQSHKSPLVAQFERTLGLAVVDAFCMKANSRFGESAGGYYLQIDAAPRAASQTRDLHVIGIKLTSFYGQLPEELMQDLAIRIREQQGEVARIHDGSIWYYSENPIAVTLWPASGLSTDRSCSRQQERLMSALYRVSDFARPRFYCLEQGSPGSGLQRGFGIWNGRRPVEFAMTATETYASLDDCLWDLDRLESLAGPTRGLFREKIGVACVRSASSLDPRHVYEARWIEAW